jgi:repressor LexA
MQLLLIESEGVDMRRKSPELMERIRNFIESCYFEVGVSFTTEIGDAVGIARGTAYKYLVAMEERGLISYEDGSAKPSVCGR